MRKPEPFRIGIFIVFILFVIYGIYSAVKTYFPAKPQQAQVSATATVAPEDQTPIQKLPTATPRQIPAVQPTVAPIIPAPEVSPVQTGSGSYPALCQPGDTRPELVAAMDDYAGFYQLIYRIMAMPASDHYCIRLMPKWSGPNWDKNGYSESDIEDMMKRGEIDIYFGSNGALALWDANSGIVIWSTDQSAGADTIVVNNSVATHFDPKTNAPLPEFNDALGQTVCTSRGSADHYFILKALQAVGFLNGDVEVRLTDTPVPDFQKNLCAFVAYWDPIIRDALPPKTADTQPIITTRDWRTISDYVVVSRQADANKSDAVLYFLWDLNLASEHFTVNNLPETAKLLVNFEFDGDNMAPWLWIAPETAVEDFTRLMDGVALSKFNDNVNMFTDDGTGWNLVKDQFNKTHATFQLAGILDNSKDNSKGSVYNPDVFISDKYVVAMTKLGAKSIKGVFSNKYITDINQNLPDIDKNKLFKMPVLFSMKDQDIKFVQDNARQLMPGQLEKLTGLVRPIAYLMAESPDSVIVIRGGSGFYSTNKDLMEEANRFAFRRAMYIKEILSDPEGLNIPAARIVVDTQSKLPDHDLSTAELPDYMVVIISVVNTGSFK